MAKVKRMAYQIAENNFNEKELILVGIKNRGSKLAELLAKELKNIQNVKVQISTVHIEKRNPLEDEIELKKAIQKPDDKVVILIDDVANTGRTLCYAIKPLLDFLPAKIQVAVLVDRKHKKFPIHADYIGLQLSTVMEDYVKVSLEPGKEEVYLE